MFLLTLRNILNATDVIFYISFGILQIFFIVAGLFDSNFWKIFLLFLVIHTVVLYYMARFFVWHFFLRTILRTIFVIAVAITGAYHAWHLSLLNSLLIISVIYSFAVYCFFKVGRNIGDTLGEIFGIAIVITGAYNIWHWNLLNSFLLGFLPLILLGLLSTIENFIAKKLKF